MKTDIENTDDIRRLVNAFYAKALNDATIGYIFRAAPDFSFEKHILIMISFWETLLFGIASYKGNPMLKHLALNKTIPLNKDHFNQWLYLWEETVNEIFKGVKAKEAIAKAKSIGGLMQYKINTAAGIQICR